MAENWAAIAGDVTVALESVGFEVTLHPAQTEMINPWDVPGAAPADVILTCIDSGLKEVYIQGSTATRLARKLMINAGVVVPKVGDTITVRGRVHDVLSVAPLAPGGVDLFYDIEISV